MRPAALNGAVLFEQIIASMTPRTGRWAATGFDHRGIQVTDQGRFRLIRKL